jgi:release factor glutamine methyltransferase
VELRAAGLPLEHVLGWVEFCGLRVAVSPGVFVPRRRTELLVREATLLGRRVAAGKPAVLLDMCCGSGAVGAALAASLGSVELHVVDLDPVAVTCARVNLTPVGGVVYEGDLYQPLPSSVRGRVDLLVVNAPYVPSDALRLMPPEARIHEPRVALDGGSDGLDVVRRVAAEAPAWLTARGHLLVETSHSQAPHAADAFTRHGLTAVRVVRNDELDATVVVGTRRSRPNDG